MSHQAEPPSKKRRQGHHPLQRRFLVVPSSSLDEILEGDIYNDNMNEDNLWQGILCQPGRSRPFPSCQILSSTFSIGNDHDAVNRSPLLQNFYHAVGMTDKLKQGKSTEEKEAIENGAAKDLEDIDNPALSKLTLGQHTRYLQLTSKQQTDRRTEKERKELRALTHFVKVEQQAYQEALEKFFATNKCRFLTGFNTSGSLSATFCRWASSHNKLRNQQLALSIPIKLFGKCRQVISLPAPSDSRSSLDMQGLGDFKIVYCSDENCPSIDSEELMNLKSSRIPPPAENRAPEISLLQNDELALRLAEQHKTCIVTTAETLETLLLLPGDFMARWMIHATTKTVTTTTTDESTRVVLLDAPIAQPFLSPRECLESGIQEGLYQCLTANKSNNGDDSPALVKYIYTLWTLPQKRQLRRHQVRVLVRSTYRLSEKPTAGSAIGTTNIPVRLRSHLEYFPERGKETLTSYERALWILDQLLLQHRVSTRLCRVNPRTCSVLAWEETSVAHAFCDDGVNPLVLHYPALLQILQSIPILDIEKSCLIFCQQNSLSVSVHAPEDTNVSTAVAKIDLGPILEQADGVMLSEKALSHCPRRWEWETTDRVPFTFPVRDSAKALQEKGTMG